MGQKIYFSSDFHLGVPDRESSLVREKKLVAWLKMARADAAEIFLMGDLFDFWFEYRTVIPRGYARLMGELADIADSGIPVHLFLGNHDMWAFSYLAEEVGVQLHPGPEFREFSGSRFYLAHGDALGPGDLGYKLIKKIFANRFNQWLFRWFHPDFGIRMGLFWSRKSRGANLEKEKKDREMNLNYIHQRLSVHSGALLEQHPDLDYLIYGHYHYPLDETLNGKARQIVLGDWITHFSYAVFDGKKMELKVFEDNGCQEITDR